MNAVPRLLLVPAVLAGVFTFAVFGVACDDGGHHHHHHHHCHVDCADVPADDDDGGTTEPEPGTDVDAAADGSRTPAEPGIGPATDASADANDPDADTEDAGDPQSP